LWQASGRCAVGTGHRLSSKGEAASKVVNALDTMVMIQNTKKGRSVDGFTRPFDMGAIEPLQVVRIHHGKNQHFQNARHQKGGPGNPHQALAPHRSCLLGCAAEQNTRSG
jgi:hypothetical protein